MNNGVGSGSDNHHPLRILISSLFFHPEPIGISRVTGEMARWFVGRGHRVRVVCGVPFYPKWRKWDGYEGVRLVHEAWDGVEIVRVPLWVPRRPTGLSRIQHLAGYGILATPLVAAHSHWRPDIVFSVQPTVAPLIGVFAACRLAGAVSWHHVQDFELDAAVGLGLLGPSWVGGVVARIERRMFGLHDVVSTISPGMLKHLEKKTGPACKSYLFPNWVDTDAIRPANSRHYRSRLGIAQDVGVALYSGNMGNKQGIEVVLDAAKLLRGEEDLLFVLAGDGSERVRLEEMAEGLPNVRWLPLQPKEHLAEFLSMADVHLMPQRAEAEEIVLPSKLNTIFAVGGAVVATAGDGSSLGKAVGRCGVVVPPGSAHELAAAVSTLIRDQGRRLRFGAEARRIAESELSMASILGDVERAMYHAVTQKRVTQKTWRVEN